MSDRVAPFSAKVKIVLCVEGREIPVGQTGPFRLVLRDPLPAPLECGDAEVVMTVDGRESRWPVTIIDPVGVGESEVVTFPVWPG